ncbi:outer membrane lipoprotein carrier protein LolA [uncultured Shewanella sp.]|uniref:outer membrane lipoprotein carrier protein LolA n=1 Tax=uncultured Shewanella sp. TaxID=173975 RepID=UPI00261436C3|nr:outer membrane lipoprotein carrier protein LolA [uncultured Shewanella sp.]
MKSLTFIRVCYFLILSFFPSLLFANTSAYDDTLFSHPATESTLKALSSQLHFGSSASGDFTQYRQLKVLKKPLVSHGHFLFDQHRGLVWQQLRPFKSSLILKDKQLIQVNSQGHIQIQDAGNIPAASALENIMPSLLNAMLTGDIKQLEQDFSISFLQAKKQWQLGLIPKDPLVAKILPKMIIEGQTSINQLVLFSPNGDSSKIVFSHIQNRPLTMAELNAFNPDTKKSKQTN